MPNQFFAEQGPFGVTEDIEEIFATDYWLFEQYIGDQLWAWGSNSNGQLGDNTIASRSTPRQEITSSTNWKQVSSGGNYTAAIKTDGTLWAWGANDSGQLGDNTRASRSTPVREFTLSTNWKLVACGENSTAAIKTDGTLWTWGSNRFGQLGDNTTVSRSTPIQVGTATNWKQVSVGGHFFNRAHIAAIKTDGTLWTWGYNDLGGLGVNDRIDRSTPVQEFTSSTNWKQVISTGSNTNSTIALKTDGTLWWWGYFGIVFGTTFNGRSTPTQVGTDSNWKQISYSSYDHFAGIKVNGTLWTTGNNNYGQLGVNDLTDRSTFVQEITLSSDWKHVACSQDSVYAIKTNGTLWAWGRNDNGQLGDNTIASRSTPRQEFTSSTNWKCVSINGQPGDSFFITAVKTGIDIATGTLT